MSVKNPRLARWPKHATILPIEDLVQRMPAFGKFAELEHVPQSLIMGVVSFRMVTSFG